MRILHVKKKNLPDKKKDKECEESILRFAKEAKAKIKKWQSELEPCEHCGQTIDKGACFYCKMD